MKKVSQYGQEDHYAEKLNRFAVSAAEHISRELEGQRKNSSDDPSEKDEGIEDYQGHL